MDLERTSGLDALKKKFKTKYPDTSKSKITQIKLGLDHEGAAEIISDMREVVDGYDTIQENDEKNIRTDSSEGPLIRRAFWIHEIPVSKDVAPVSISARKTFKTFTVDQPAIQHKKGDKVVRIAFDLSRGNSEIGESNDAQTKFHKERGPGGTHAIGSVILEQIGPTEWKIDHRYVEPQYRGKQGAFELLMEAAENFVKAYGLKTGQPQKVKISIGQPQLIKSYEQLGYQPSSPADRAVIDEIMVDQKQSIRDAVEGIFEEATKPEFELDYAVSTEEGIPEKNDLPFLFPKGTPKKTRDHAIRINLEKPINSHL